MSKLAESLINQVCEATLVPLELESEAKEYGGCYKAYVDKCWVFWFRFEEDAVSFMNDIDVDIAANAGEGVCMNVEKNRTGYLVYVPEDKYAPEPEPENDVPVPPPTNTNYDDDGHVAQPLLMPWEY